MSAGLFVMSAWLALPRPVWAEPESRAAGGVLGFTLAPEMIRDLDGLEAGLRKTLAGRRLLAETSDVPRRSRALQGETFSFQRGRPSCLYVDAEELKKRPLEASRLLWPWEFELILARELAKASLALPIELPEGEMAAIQLELGYAVERAQGDNAFSQRLKEALGLMRGRAASSSLQLVVASPLALTPLPKSELEKVAFYILLFRRDEEEFYWAVERSRRWGQDFVRQTELEDFIELRGRDLDALPREFQSPYVRIAGRRYPAALPRAARELIEAGGLPRLHEALDSFETTRSKELKAKIDGWLGVPSAP